MEKLDGIERAADEVIEELRIANLALDEMELLRKEEEDFYRAELQKERDLMAKLELALVEAESELLKLSDLWRNHLDEADYEDDNQWERQVRQMLCTDADVEQKI